MLLYYYFIIFIISYFFISTNIFFIVANFDDVHINLHNVITQKDRARLCNDALRISDVNIVLRMCKMTSQDDDGVSVSSELLFICVTSSDFLCTGGQMWT